MISDIWRCDGRETLPLMPMSGSPLIGVMHCDPEVPMRGSRVLACVSLRAIECYLGDRDGTSVLLSDHELVGS